MDTAIFLDWQLKPSPLSSLLCPRPSVWFTFLHVSLSLRLIFFPEGEERRRVREGSIILMTEGLHALEFLIAFISQGLLSDARFIRIK